MIIQLHHVNQDEDGAPTGITTFYLNTEHIIHFCTIDQAKIRTTGESLAESNKWNNTVIETTSRVLTVKETPEEVLSLSGEKRF